jgi:hypothetical protein
MLINFLVQVDYGALGLYGPLVAVVCALGLAAKLFANWLDDRASKQKDKFEAEIAVPLRKEISELEKDRDRMRNCIHNCRNALFPILNFELKDNVRNGLLKALEALT